METVRLAFAASQHAHLWTKTESDQRTTHGTTLNSASASALAKVMLTLKKINLDKHKKKFLKKLFKQKKFKK